MSISLQGVELSFPHLIDNTIRSDASHCQTKALWGYFMNLAPHSPSVHLHAGGAFASGLEAARRAYFEQRLSVDESLKAGLVALIKFYGPIEFPPTRGGDKSCDNVVRAFDSYFRQYPLDKDPLRPFMAPNGKAMVEFTFAMPMELSHPVTGNPLLYGGRADMIAHYNDTLMVTDEKTASALGEQWQNQWELDSQFTGYIKATKEHGFPVSGAVVRGVGLLKTKISHAEAIIYRSPWEIDRWWQQLHDDTEELITAWKTNKFRQALSKAVCGAYGGCSFTMLCKSPNPLEWTQIHFRERKWNPLVKDMGEKLLDNAEFMAKANAPELALPDLDR